MLLIALCLLGCAAPEDSPNAAQIASYHFPALTGRVVDAAHLIPAEEASRLAARSAALERATGRQFVIVTAQTLSGYTIEDYGLMLGRTWRIGRKGYDDGVLLIVAPNERRVRIEVGYGLERQLRDKDAGAIIERDIIPAFKAGNIPLGVERGADDIIRKITPPGRKAA